MYLFFERKKESKKGQFLISQNISVYFESTDFASDSYFTPLENYGLEVIRNIAEYYMCMMAIYY